MKQVLIRRGQIHIEKVPAPLVEPGHILVEVAYSLISAGTEISGVTSSGKPLFKRAIEQPDKVMKVLELVRSQGVQKTFARVRGQLDGGQPTGYSCSGMVLEVGEGVHNLHVGDRVACAGAGIANHAELVLVPKNLVVKVPDTCDLRAASSVTLGAIAMQGIRRADPRLGEVVAVIGLGLLGQLTVQLLHAAGCRVIGFDLDQRRVELARQSGAECAFLSSEVNIVNEINHLTQYHGVDSVLITAATTSDTVVQQAMEIARKKGRIVVVGAVGLGLKRSPFYEKEIDFLISCSYGPGRYDSAYEEEGVDYPYAYVRWTENRNMSEYLRLVGEGKVKLDAIIEKEYPLEKAAQGYADLQNETEKPLGVVLRYSGDMADGVILKKETQVQFKKTSVTGKVRIAIVGAGDFAKGMHLPNLQKLNDLYHIRAIVSGTGSNAKAVANQFGADYATSNYTDVLNDPEVDAVLISTRHNLHARQSIEAARAGKAIFLEKPMALNQNELEELENVLKETKVPFMVGFNRRFSPAIQKIGKLLQGRQSPIMILYRVNAGYLPLDHWTQGAEGGGRIVGEACHMLDVFQFLTNGSDIVDATATPILPSVEHILSSDNMTITVRYAEGSVATLLYTALGTSSLNKEYIEVYNDNKVFVVDDYKSLQIHGIKKQDWNSSTADKGHLTELQSFARFLLQKSSEPIPLSELISTTSLTLQLTQK